MKIVSGKVITGDKRGRKIGFPTANLRYDGKLNGIYAVRVQIDGRKYKGAANIGYAPTFNRRKKLLEVYIFRFNKNIAGKKIEVELVKKIRNEKKFDSAKELVKEIKKDVRKVKTILK